MKNKSKLLKLKMISKFLANRKRRLKQKLINLHRQKRSLISSIEAMTNPSAKRKMLRLTEQATVFEDADTADLTELQKLVSKYIEPEANEKIKKLIQQKTGSTEELASAIANKIMAAKLNHKTLKNDKTTNDRVKRAMEKRNRKSSSDDDISGKSDATDSSEDAEHAFKEYLISEHLQKHSLTSKSDDQYYTQMFDAKSGKMVWKKDNQGAADKKYDNITSIHVCT